MARRGTARRYNCPYCEKSVAIKADGTVWPHVNWKDQARTGNCRLSGYKVAEDLTAFVQ